MKKLPDAEFELMKAIWSIEPPVTTAQIRAVLDKDWKGQTVLTLLSRLTERGFLKSEKNGKERNYYPLVTREEYLRFETGNFLENYHENSISSLVSTLFDNKRVSEEEFAELRELLNKRDR